MSLQIKQNKHPELHIPKFICDKKLHKKLDNYDLTSLCNKSNFMLFLGRAGSGKTSLLVSFLNTPELFRKCFHYIYVFMPSTSRSSLKDNFFERNIPEDQLYDNLDYEGLLEVYDRIRENSENNKQSLIILDDVQKYLKGDCEKLLLEIVNNRRHIKCSLWMACQTYNSIPRQVRQGLTNIFVFKINKREMQNIFDEQVELYKERFEEVLNSVYKEPHDYLFIDTNTQRMFCKFNELCFPDT